MNTNKEHKGRENIDRFVRRQKLRKVKDKIIVENATVMTAIGDDHVTMKRWNDNSFLRFKIPKGSVKKESADKVEYKKDKKIIHVYGFKGSKPWNDSTAVGPHKLRA